MDKKFLLAGLLIALVVFSGCVKIEIKEDIKANGMSDMSLIMDLSAIPDDPDSEVNMAEENPCDGMTEEMQAGDSPLQLTNITCTFEDKVLSLSGTLDRSNSEAITIDGDTFRIDVKKALESVNQTESAEQLPEGSEQLAQLKMMGFEYNYLVRLPGTLVKQEGGEEQEDGFVKFDVLGLPEEAFVETTTASTGSFDADTTTIIVGVAVVVIVLGAAAFFIMRK